MVRKSNMKSQMLRRERENGIEAVFEAMMDKNFLKLIKAIRAWIKTYFE